MKPAQIATVAARSKAESPRVPAIAYCQGTPLRNEIEARDAKRLDEATDTATVAIAQRFGPRAVDGKIQAHVVTIETDGTASRSNTQFHATVPRCALDPSVNRAAANELEKMFP